MHSISLKDQRYRRGQVLGKGQAGIVFRALDTLTGHVVALKLVKRSVETINEFNLLSKLVHPNIVQLYGQEQTRDELSIVMEFCETGSLAQLLQSFGALSERLSCVYLSQYIHEQGVIHRDIKSANILTTKNGIAKLSDFGISSIKEQSRGIFEGSAYWMAPEVIELNGTSWASDIWSIGCTTIELLTGKPPFYDLEPASALFRIVSDDRVPYPEYASLELTAFLDLCFQRNPNFRSSASLLKESIWIKLYSNNNPIQSPEQELFRRVVDLERFREVEADDYTQDFDQTDTIELKGKASASEATKQKSHTIEPNFALDIQLTGLIEGLKDGNNLESFGTFFASIDRLPSTMITLFLTRVEELLNDRNPKIRLLMVDQLRKLLTDNRGENRNYIQRILIKHGIHRAILSGISSYTTEELHSDLQYSRSDIIHLLSQGPKDIRLVLAHDRNFKCILSGLKLNGSLVMINLLRTVKNLSQCSENLDSFDSCGVIEQLCSILWRTHSKADLEVQTLVLCTLSSVLRLDKDRLQRAVLAGIVEPLKELTKSNRPVRQFAIQLVCELAKEVRSECLWLHEIPQTLVALLEDICWRATSLEALSIWLTADFKLMEAFLSRVDLGPFLNASLQSDSSQDTEFFSKISVLLGKSAKVSRHFLSSKSILPLLLKNINGLPAVQLDILRILNCLLVVKKDCAEDRRLARALLKGLKTSSVVVREAARRCELLLLNSANSGEPKRMELISRESVSLSIEI